MYIYSIRGELLQEFNRYDVRSVAIAEAWIKHHGLVIWKMEIVSGIVILTVK